ncbi:trypsin-like peptidase domain-containing protein [Thalassotalea sp. M1531]|uniref:Trypsin-like peptidase domain-containing protein n=1 Tax=Thalassotalea algicola TaxID=2716224 RepID=A0A7Y0LEM9_9GAMM|nr:trypsin-like peptidase domain-containing protein [Thalassotalea algicola]NMP33120.1 trypsin-like peptidase domain-containing protein [Thalassotalea algicola]
MLLKPLSLAKASVKVSFAVSLCISSSFILSSAHAQDTVQYSGVNNISFHQTAYDKTFAGNGFLISVADKLYAVTVKHTLFEAKTPEMKHVAIEKHVKEWRIHPKQSPNEYIVLGRLLNADITEAIDMKILQKDWLVFEVIENHSPLTPLTLRESEVTKGETLTAYGCAYVNQQQCQQDTYQGQFIAYEPNNLRMKLDNLQMDKLRGLSGSPVLDTNNQVVGIVSNVLKSQTSEGFDFAPANLKYLSKVLAKISAKRV